MERIYSIGSELIKLEELERVLAILPTSDLIAQNSRFIMARRFGAQAKLENEYKFIDGELDLNVARKCD